MPKQLCHRFCKFERASIDAEKRTVELAFSSELPVDRGGYDEVLDHSANSCDLSRLNDGHPLLLNHSAYDGRAQIGVVESARIDSDKIGRALVRFSKSELAEQIFQDVKDGIRRHVSVGYERTEVISSAKTNNREIIRYRWLPYEISIVTIPADPTVGIGRELVTAPEIDNPTTAVTPAPGAEPANENKDMKRSALGNILLDPSPSAGGGGTATDTRVVEVNTLTKERKRYKDINAAADALAKDFPQAADKFREMATKAIDGETSTEDFNAQLLAAIPGIRKIEKTESGIGMTEKDVRNYSLLRAIQSVIRSGKLEGFEAEIHQEVEKKSRGLEAGGFWVPSDVTVGIGQRDILLPGRRDLTVGAAAQGGNLVATNLITPIIELLRNRAVTVRLGVQQLAGLQGAVAIPRQTGAATAYSVAETGALTESHQALNQLTLSPKRVGAFNEYSKQLLLQSSIDVEGFVRNDLMAVLALKHDLHTLEGSGAANEPTGILLTSGIGGVTFGGAPAWQDVVDFETDVATANADVRNMAYAMTPAVRGKWKTTEKATNTGLFLWPDARLDDSGDGMVNGYRAAVTNQISSDKVFFGNWADAIIAMWGGFDVVVDPFTLATTGLVRITINTFMDVAVRHAASFSVSSDSGAQ